MTIKNKGSNYLAKIVELKGVRKHTNADKLQCVDIDYQTVITGLTAKDGDLYVFFPVGTAINKEFLSSTNSFASRELNSDKNVKGYFKKSGAVRATKLRGEKSFGYIVPLEVFEKFFGVVGLPSHINEEFDTINGQLVCEKYVIPNSNVGTLSKGKQTKSLSRLVSGQVYLHNDTDNLRKNTGVFNSDSKFTITYKLHGCLPGSQKIKMSDGKTKRISEIKVGDFVLGYDHKLNKYVKSEVQDTFINGKTKEWYQIKKVNSVKGLGRSQEILRCTGNHKIYTTTKGYIPASELSLTDKILTYNKTFDLSPELISFLKGKLLGDAHIDRSNSKWAIGFGHKKEHEDYVNNCTNVLGNMFTGVIKKRISGFGTNMLFACSKRDYSINNLFSSWFNPSGTKIIPHGFILDDISLAYWYMDDGSLSHTKLQRDRANFAVCGFNEKSLVNLDIALRKFGFNNYTFYKDNNGYPRLRLNASDADLLFKSIARYIPKCMQYKIPNLYTEGVELSTFSFKGDKTYKSIVVDIETIEIVSPSTIRGQVRKYDIQTETSNFVSGGILIHNSSGWASNVIVKKKLSTLERILKRVGLNIVDTEYDIVYGSRRVVKNKGFDPKGSDHYYSYDLWGEVVEKNEISSKLPRGYSIYYEIVGFTRDKGYIQSGYDYGCNQDIGENKIFVYRVTYTNPDGKVYNLNSMESKIFCDKQGLEFVPIMFQGSTVELLDKLKIEDTRDIIPKLEERYNDKDCHMNKSKVPEEGIVLRVEDNYKFEAYKLKSFSFLERESNQKTSNIEDQN